MNTFMVTFRAGMAAVVMLAVAVPGVVSAGPAQPDKGTGCLVRDANLVQNADLVCYYHEVFKDDNRSNEQTLLHYQDHGQLPVVHLGRKARIADTALLAWLAAHSPFRP